MFGLVFYDYALFLGHILLCFGKFGLETFNIADSEVECWRCSRENSASSGCSVKLVEAFGLQVNICAFTVDNHYLFNIVCQEHFVLELVPVYLVGSSAKVYE